MEVVAGSTGGISDARYQSFGANNCRYPAYLKPEIEDEERDCVMACVKGKHGLFQRFFRADQLVNALVDFPPQHPAVTFAIKACLHGAWVVLCPVGGKNGFIRDHPGLHSIVPLMCC